MDITTGTHKQPMPTTRQTGWTLVLTRTLRIVAALLLLWGMIVVGLVAAIYFYGDDNPVMASGHTADAIVVLGSGLRRDGSPGDALLRRSIWAARLYEQGAAPAVICTGGVGQGQRRSEADACREVLVARGVPESAIHLEDRSHSTEENAIYAREIMQANDWHDAVLVTDSFHMLRANWIFRSQDIEHYRSPVPRQWMRSYWYVRHTTREVLALHWQAFKQLLGLPVTSFSLN
ncbi:MAG: YdcF family protein [Phototrophicaceae bacterium]